MRHPKRSLLFALACAIAGTAQTAHAQTLRYQFKEKDKLIYSIEHKGKSTGDIMGAKIDLTQDASTSVQWEVLKVDSEGNALVKMKVTRSKFVIDTPTRASAHSG
jgi:hypothetical protein